MNYLRPAVIGLLALVAILALFAQGEPAYAATITVNSTADVIADDGVCTLREAITGANTDTASGAMGGECTAGSGADTITVPAGTYTLSIAGANEDANASGDLDIIADLTVTGAGAGSSIIDGGGIDRVFHITVVTPGGVAATVEISGLTIRNGALSEGNGGGIGNLGDLTLTDVTVSANSAQEGGGGIWNPPGGTVALINSTVSGNSAEGGGGISNSQGGTVSLINSTVSGNSAWSSGGIASEGPLTLDNSTVSGNSAFGGGGITISGTDCATASFTNSTVSGNSATAGSGGGLLSDGCGNLILTNSTVSGNTASDGGGGIWNGALASTATLKNTIVANSTAGGDCSGTITSDGYNLDSDGTCSFTATGDLQNTDPLLGPLANNGGPTFTHALLAGSPAIEAGSPDCPPPATDQRGVARPQGAACDIGAYEHAPTITVTTTDDELNSDGDCSLREAIQAANTDAAVDACSAGSGADTITVPAGTYTLTIAGTAEDAAATGDLDITDDLAITGAGAATTIIDGGALDGVFDVRSGSTVDISGVTVQNGSGSPFAGGILASGGSTLTLTDVTISGNSGSNSGGVFNGNATMTLTNVTVSGNASTGGGAGIWNDDLGTMTLTNVTVSGNTAGSVGGGIVNFGTLTVTNVTVSANTTTSASGGGIYNAVGTSTVTDSTIEDNDAMFGGGISVVSGGVTLTDSTVSGNTSITGGGGIWTHAEVTLINSTVSGNTDSGFNGGGIGNDSGAVTLTNSTVSGNTSNNDGGGIWSDFGALTLTNSTVTANTSVNAGGGIANGGQGGSTVTLKNTIVANNGAVGDCSGTITSDGYNLDSDGTCGLGSTGDLPSTSPLLSALADNGGPTATHALQSSSPAIDAGSPDCPPPATDQRGVTRPVDGDSDSTATCDMGAYEAFGLSPSFSDVAADHFAFAHIEALFGAGITTGCGGGNYCPNDPVTRAQMAVFIILALNDAPVTPTGVFADVPTSHFAAGFIERLAELGITAGCGGGNYCPNDPVTRAQMAVFIVVALDDAPVTPTGVFADVPTSHFAAGFIERLAELGITAGCGGGNYCPNDPVTRAQMAVFIVVAFNLPLPP